MAITTSAKKAQRQNVRRRKLNDARRATLRVALKGVRVEATNKTGSSDGKQAALAAAYKAIDKAMKRGLLKKNTAARRKAKIAKLLKA